MSESTSVELLKYPIAIFSVLLALVVARHALGLEFGLVTEVTASGVKFAEKKGQATFEALTTLEGRVTKGLIELEELKKAVSKPVDSPELKAKLFEAEQTVSDQTAKVEKIQPPTASRRSQLSGYIYIGDYNGSWARPKLALEAGQAVSAPPSALRMDTEYKLLGNMVVRDGRPDNGSEYYKARAILGVVPLGRKVRLLSEPIGFARSAVTQYWAEIEVVP